MAGDSLVTLSLWARWIDGWRYPRRRLLEDMVKFSMREGRYDTAKLFLDDLIKESEPTSPKPIHGPEKDLAEALSWLTEYANDHDNSCPKCGAMGHYGNCPVMAFLQRTAPSKPTSARSGTSNQGLQATPPLTEDQLSLAVPSTEKLMNNSAGSVAE